MPGMRSLLQEELIGAVGVSNYSLHRWLQADEALGQPVVSNQVQFSLAHAAPMEDLVPFAQRENRIVIAYSPLAQGMLGGKYTVDNRPGGVRAVNPLFGTENLRRVAPLLDTLRQVADAHNVMAAQVALAWLLSLPQVVVIPGASSVEQLELNVAAADLELDAPSQAALTEAARAFTPISAVSTLVGGLRTRLGVLPGSESFLERRGFLHNQVSPGALPSGDGQTCGFNRSRPRRHHHGSRRRDCQRRQQLSGGRRRG
jgi:diketogulonate reductase-like aldo/keto reductase